MESAQDLKEHPSVGLSLLNYHICDEFRNVHNDLMELLGELPVTFEYLTKDVSAIIKRRVAKRGPAEDLWLLEGVPVV